VEFWVVNIVMMMNFRRTMNRTLLLLVNTRRAIA